jgi:hypothetical protein
VQAETAGGQAGDSPSHAGASLHASAGSPQGEPCTSSVYWHWPVVGLQIPLFWQGPARGWHSTGVPWQAPVLPQTSSSVQGLPSSQATPGVGAQWPAPPATLQAKHGPSQAESQQTPSTQYPDWHWSSPAQVSPSARSPSQTPSLQKAAPTHSSLLWHVVRQAVPSALQV